MAGDARQEEGRGQEGRAGAREAAQARRGRRREDRLIASIRSWWERDPAALDAEIKELTTAGFRVRRDLSGGDRRLTLVVESDGTSYRIVYHHAPSASGDRFYASTPAVGDGVPRRFIEGFDGVAAIRDLEYGGGEPLRDFEEGSVFVPRDWEWNVIGAGGTIKLGRSRFDSRSYAVRSLTGSRVGLRGLEEVQRAFPEEVSSIWARGRLPSVDQESAETVVAAAEKILADVHGSSALGVRMQMRAGVCAIVYSPNLAPGRAEWHFVRRGVNDEPLVLSPLPLDTESYWQRAPFGKTLEGKRVAMIGCGAVGWTVALQLARSGVRHFDLFDDDLVRDYNLARLGGYLGSVGRTKARALAEQLESVAAGVVAEPHTDVVGTHVGAAALLEVRPDLLINLTGEEISTDETNAAALLLSKKALFAWTSNGVLAGRIFRVRPFESACYECMRDAEPTPIRSMGVVPTAPEEAWDGACFDVDTFSSAVTRLAVLTLAGAPVSATNPDHVVLDFGGVTPKSHVVHISRNPLCEVCR